MKLELKLILFVVCQMANAFDEEPLPTFALPIEVIEFPEVSEKIIERIEQETLAPEVPIEDIEIIEVFEDIDGVLEKGSLPAAVPEKMIDEEVVTEVTITSTCNAMAPVDPINQNGTLESSETPVKLYLDSTQGYYRIVPGQKVSVKLQSVSGFTFQEFIIQAKDKNNKSIGNFEVDDSLRGGLISCDGGQNNILINTNAGDKTLIEANWVAPDNYKGNIQFTYSFALDDTRYYTGLQLGPLAVRPSKDLMCDPIYELTSCQGTSQWGRALCITGVWICDFCKGVNPGDVRFPACNETSKLCNAARTFGAIRENWSSTKCQESEPFIGLQCDIEKSKILIAGGGTEKENFRSLVPVPEVELIGNVQLSTNVELLIL